MIYRISTLANLSMRSSSRHDCLIRSLSTHGMRSVAVIRLTILLLVTLYVPAMEKVWAADGTVTDISESHDVHLLTHQLIVEVDPDRHRLIATDRMALKIIADEPREVSFLLSAALQVTQIVERSGEQAKRLSFTAESRIDKDSPDAMQRLIVILDPSGLPEHTVTLEWHYGGFINDPPREPRHVRFVTPSETAGHIGPEGVYLSGETHWYPDLPGSVSTYHITVTTPQGWHTVSHGRLVAETVHDQNLTAQWDVEVKTETLTLVANRFVKHHRQWHEVEIATYLFPEDVSLAEEYLDAASKYLETYTKLLGPYPFPKFAVVENFFASGLGMPSFTLLGSGVVKRHYVQPYALGHEIVHSWIGNWVFNDTKTGNWVEGLTTYLANYYYDELTGTAEQASTQRRMMVLGYAVYVRSDEDYPVGEFRHKTDQKDNAIGYQKAAMIFHMLRREIGDEAFWQGIRKLISDFGGSRATWEDVERILARTGQRDLRWFFSQWVERKGAPILSVSGVQTSQLVTGSENGVHVKGQLTQSDPPYRLRLPVRIKLRDGRVSKVELDMRSTEYAFTVLVPGEPASFEVDPDFDAFRRLGRNNLPPMLNLFVTDHDRFVILPARDDSPARQPYEDLAARMKSQDRMDSSVIVITDHDISAVKEPESLNGSVLVLGGPILNRLTEWAIRGCGDRIRLNGNNVMVNGRVYEGPELAVLVSCRHPKYPNHVVTVFFGQTPATATKIARLLFFYGWQSYVVFREGVVVERGDFPPEANELEVRFHAS